jgi:hypothetical protein
MYLCDINVKIERRRGGYRLSGIRMQPHMNVEKSQKINMLFTLIALET